MIKKKDENRYSIVFSGEEKDLEKSFLNFLGQLLIKNGELHLKRVENSDKDKNMYMFEFTSEELREEINRFFEEKKVEEEYIAIHSLDKIAVENPFTEKINEIIPFAEHINMENYKKLLKVYGMKEYLSGSIKLNINEDQVSIVDLDLNYLLDTSLEVVTGNIDKALLNIYSLNVENLLAITTVLIIHFKDKVDKEKVSMFFGNNFKNSLKQIIDLM